MAFDAGPQSDPARIPSEPRTARDVLDLVLRVLILVPIIGLYTWWAVSTMWGAVKAGFGL